MSDGTGVLAGMGLVILGYLLGQDGKPTAVLVRPVAEPGTQPVAVPLAPNGPAFGLTEVVPEAREYLALEPIAEGLVERMQPYGTSTTYWLDTLLNAWLAAKVLLIVTSTCNQALTVQVVGHETNAPGDSVGLMNIGGTYSLPAGGRLGFGIDLETDWYPYLGVTIASGGTPPTTGSVVVYAYGQRWVRRIPTAEGRIV